MGSGIATALLLSGYQVILKEVNQKFLEGGLGRVKGINHNKVNTLLSRYLANLLSCKFLTNIFYVHTGNLSSSVRKGKLSQEKMEKILSSLKGVLDYESFKDVDMVIEVLILTI